MLCSSDNTDWPIADPETEGWRGDEHFPLWPEPEVHCEYDLLLEAAENDGWCYGPDDVWRREAR